MLVISPVTSANHRRLSKDFHVSILNCHLFADVDMFFCKLFRQLNATLAAENSIIDRVDHLNEIYSSEALAACQHIARKCDDAEESWEYF